MTTEKIDGANSGPGYAKYPDHIVELRPFSGLVEVRAADRKIAASDCATLLTETGYSPVYYLPRTDVDFAFLAKMELSTYCPFKGHARYWRLVEGEQAVLWAYESPYDEVSGLSSYVAFYQDRVSMRVREAE